MFAMVAPCTGGAALVPTPSLWVCNMRAKAAPSVASFTTTRVVHRVTEHVVDFSYVMYMLPTREA